MSNFMHIRTYILCLYSDMHLGDISFTDKAFSKKKKIH